MPFSLKSKLSCLNNFSRISLPKDKKPSDYIGKFVTAEVTNSKLTVLYGKLSEE